MSRSLADRTRPSREPAPPCTRAQGTTSALDVVHGPHGRGAGPAGARGARSPRHSRPGGRAQSFAVVVASLWKLPEPWTHRTRPPLLGKRADAFPTATTDVIVSLHEDRRRQRRQGSLLAGARGWGRATRCARGCRRLGPFGPRSIIQGGHLNAATAACRAARRRSCRRAGDSGGRASAAARFGEVVRAAHLPDLQRARMVRARGYSFA